MTTRHELLVTRLLTAGNGVLAVAACLGVLTVVVQSRPAPLPTIFQSAVIALYGFIVVAAVIAPWCGRRIIAAVNGVAAIGFLTLCALAWPVLLLTGSARTGQLLWLLTVIALPILAAVVAWGQRGGWIVLGVLAVFIPLLRLAMGDVSANAITNDVQAFATAVLLCALAGATLGRARRADIAAQAAGEAGEREAETAARRDVETRAQALVHDEVLATLGFAARATEEMRPALAVQARNAWEALRALSRPEQQATDAAAVTSRLQRVAAAHGTTFLVEQRDVPGVAIPADVAAAVEAAAQQALVNSRLHAPASTVSLTLAHRERGIRVVIRDDGPGFSPEDVPPGRLGIEVSIVARMRAVGGRADVTTAPGEGVIIDLAWQPSPEPRVAAAPSAPLLRDRDLRVSGALLAGGPILLALYCLVWMRQAIPSLVAGAALAAAFIIVGWRSGRASDRTVMSGGALAVIAVCTLFLSGTAVPDSAGSATYAGLWPAVGSALVLGMLCLRDRQGAASVLLVPVVGVAILAAIPGPFDELRAAIVRCIVIVAIAAVFATSIRMLDRSVVRARSLELRASAERAWLAEASMRAREKVEVWDETVGPLLLRIAEGSELTEAETRRCRELEGAFRDVYRAGRFSCDEVADAAARARGRGVDVVLVDDVPDRVIDDEQLALLRLWLVGELDRATGSFIARIHRPGRPVLATASSDASATDFGG